MKAKEKAKKKPRSLKVPKSVQDSIPYHMVYPENGIIETEPGHFCHAYKLMPCNVLCAGFNCKRLGFGSTCRSCRNTVLCGFYCASTCRTGWRKLH